MAFPLYLDEDSVNRALIRALRARGMDVTNAVDAGHVGTSDLEQLGHATADGRVLFTYNIGDFFKLHTHLLQGGKSHAGLILAPQQRYSVGEQMRRILRMSGERDAEEMRDQAHRLLASGLSELCRKRSPEALPRIMKIPWLSMDFHGVRVLAALDPARLPEPVRIQGRDVTVQSAIYHVVEHFAGHTYQIVFITKMLTGSDLAFYTLKGGIPHPTWGHEPAQVESKPADS